MEKAIFYILAAVILVFSVFTVTSRRILRAAVYLLFVLGATAAIYFLLSFDFLAAVQLTVYAGGIVVLIVFSILLTSNIDEKLEVPGIKKSLLAGIVSFAGAIICISTILQHDFPIASSIELKPTMEDIGLQLLNYGVGGYILPFEVISILLLAAMLGAIIIAKREKPQAQ